MTFHGYRWAGWLVAGTFYLFDVFLRLTCDVITSQLQADFNLSADAVSAAFASSFFYGYAAMQIPVGILLDKLGARYTIILASLLSCVGCLLFSFAETIVVGTIARVISGIGCGCGWLGTVKVTRNSFGIQDTSKVRVIFALTCMLGGIGGLVSQAPFQLLVAELGWRAAFRVAAIIPICIAVGSFFLVGDVEYNKKSDNERSETNMTIEDLLLDDDESDENKQETSTKKSQLSSLNVLCRCLRTPRMWFYAMYLGGTDAPFETFAGLWGCTFFIQVYGWNQEKAATTTTIVVVLSTISQLVVPYLQSIFTKTKQRLNILTLLALLGLLSFVPYILIGYLKTSILLRSDVIGYVSAISLGCSVASCTIIWSIISSDQMCNGTTSTGMISGAVNTVCIFYDAVIQQCTGFVLSYMWNGQKNKKNEPIYDAPSFSAAFLVLGGSFLMASIMSSLASCRSKR